MRDESSSVFQDGDAMHLSCFTESYERKSKIVTYEFMFYSTTAANKMNASLTFLITASCAGGRHNMPPPPAS